MKLKMISLIVLINTTLYSQQATSLIVNDTRTVNSNPDFYAQSLKTEFKARDIVGVPGEGAYSGMLTLAPWSDVSGDKVHQLNFNNGGIYYRNGLQSSSWGGWNKILMSNHLGNVGVGTENPESILDINANGNFPIVRGNGGYIPAGIKFRDDSYTSAGQIREWAIYKGNTWAKGLAFMRYDAVNACGSGICDVPLILLDDGNINVGVAQKLVKIQSKVEIEDNVKVNAKLEAKEIKVTLTPTADFVFEDNYNLPKLENVEKHIREKKHLPEIASAKEMEKEGVNVGEFQIKLLQKIEELTLYVIEQNNKIKLLEAKIENYESKK